MDDQRPDSISNLIYIYDTVATAVRSVCSLLFNNRIRKLRTRHDSSHHFLQFPLSCPFCKYEIEVVGRRAPFTASAGRDQVDSSDKDDVWNQK